MSLRLPRFDPPGAQDAAVATSAPEQLPLFRAEDLGPADPAKARLPQRIKALLATLDVPRRIPRPRAAVESPAAQRPVRAARGAWPDSFFDEPA